MIIPKHSKTNRVIIVLLLFIPVFLSRGEEKTVGNSSHHFISPSDFNRSFLVSHTKTSIRPESFHPHSSKAKAFFFSFILPGAGEYYAGSSKMAKIFLSSEAILWATYFSFRTYGNWKKDDYQQFAVSHAGVNLSGKDHQYFVNIENYNNIREYNDAKLRQRDPGALYPENEGYAWQWDSKTSRLKYVKLRVASDRAYNGSLFVIAGVILNHVVSGIDAIRVVRKNQNLRKNSVKVSVVGLPEGGIVLTLWKFF